LFRADLKEEGEGGVREGLGKGRGGERVNEVVRGSTNTLM